MHIAVMRLRLRSAQSRKRYAEHPDVRPHVNVP
jgi:hypothetical protein